MLLFSMLSFHSLSLLIRSSSVLAITTRLSANNNSHGKAILNSLDKYLGFNGHFLGKPVLPDSSIYYCTKPPGQIVQVFKDQLSFHGCWHLSNSIQVQSELKIPTQTRENHTMPHMPPYVFNPPLDSWKRHSSVYVDYTMQCLNSFKKSKQYRYLDVSAVDIFELHAPASDDLQNQKCKTD